MLLQELIAAISRKASTECENIRAASEREAAEIRATADREVADLREKTMKAIQAEAEILLERKYNAIRFASNARRYALKSAAIDEVWRESESAVSRIIESSDYRRILEALFSECMTEAPDLSVIKVHPSDADFIRRCNERSRRFFIVEEDPSVCGGVVFVWPDGKTSLKNTLYARLSRLKAQGNEQLSLVLFSPEKGGL